MSRLPGDIKVLYFSSDSLMSGHKSHTAFFVAKSWLKAVLSCQKKSSYYEQDDGGKCVSETRRQEVVGEPGVISVCVCGGGVSNWTCVYGGFMSHGQMPACHADSLHHRGLMRRDTTCQNRWGKDFIIQRPRWKRKTLQWLPRSQLSCHVQQRDADSSPNNKKKSDLHQSLNSPAGIKLQLLNNATPVFTRRAFPFSTGKHVHMMRLGEQRISGYGRKDFRSEKWLTMSLKYNIQLQ